ncbi:MAG: hypothetical protein R6U65_13175, partial [Perlabentimonas sp.]
LASGLPGRHYLMDTLRRHSMRRGGAKLNQRFPPTGTPSSTSYIIIPDATTTNFSPTLPASAEINTITMETAGVLNALSNEQFTINGAWSNSGGTFNASSSNIIFTNASATISGITNFYNLTINTGAALAFMDESIIRIAGTLTNNGTLNALAGGTNTVEYNGIASQSIDFPNATTFFNLAINNSAGVTLSSSTLTTVSNELTINSSMLFTVDSGKQLLVAGSIVNNAGNSGLVLKSDATGTAALIHNTDNVPATVQRYISGVSEDWHFLSSPVSNQPISGSWLPSGTYGNGTGYDLYLWNEPNSCWVYKLDVTSSLNWDMFHPGANFEVGRGYLYSVQALNPTKEFLGYLNNGTLDYRLTISSTDLGLKGFNLIGNPYPSSIDWQAPTGWSRSNLVESGGGYDMWIWNPATSNYGVSNSFTGISTNNVTQYIAPMQGFFVQAISDGHLYMDNNLRTFNGANDWLKSSEQKSSSISVSVASDSGFGSDETIIDFGYSKNQNGATKLFSKVPTAPSLYMVLGSDNLSVRYLSNTEENPAVPLSFNPGANGKFTLSCNFDQYSFETVILEDRKEKSFHDMKVNSTYSFWSSNFDAANRFVLYFCAVEDNPDNVFPAKIYTDGLYLIIDLTLVNNETKTLVYDTMGRLLLNRKLQGKTLHKLNLQANSQILIISLKNPDGGLTQKLFWK